jgi:hypothetical protein
MARTGEQLADRRQFAASRKIVVLWSAATPGSRPNRNRNTANKYIGAANSRNR